MDFSERFYERTKRLREPILAAMRLRDLSLDDVADRIQKKFGLDDVDVEHACMAAEFPDDYGVKFVPPHESTDDE